MLNRLFLQSSYAIPFIDGHGTHSAFEGLTIPELQVSHELALKDELKSGDKHCKQCHGNVSQYVPGGHVVILGMFVVPSGQMMGE